MANDLTGDFDVVAEFTLGAVDRVLAAMHCGGRFPHSWSLRVDDYPPFHFHAGAALVTGIRAVVDPQGQPVTNPRAVASFQSGAGLSAAVNLNAVNVDTPVNLPQAGISTYRGAGSAVIPGRLHPLHLIGVAQLQMGAPTISLLGNSDTSVTVHTPIMARYVPDAGTLEIPDLLRGEFQITIKIRESAHSSGTTIDVVLASAAGSMQFAPNWVSPAWSSEASQLAAIDKALVNSLTTSFEPSSTPLPPNVVNLSFKALAGGPALAMMMDLPGGNPSGPPDSASVSNVFLGGGDDFAFAVSDEFIQTMFAQSLGNLQNWAFDFTYTVETDIPNPGSWFGIGPSNITVTVATITFTVSIDSVNIDLQNGKIVVTVQGAANTATSGVPKFSFTAAQNLSLEIVFGGLSADLIAVGDPVVSASAPGIPDWVINNYFVPTAVANFKNSIANFLAGINPTVQKKLNVQMNLGGFLDSLMNPKVKPGAAPVQTINAQLAYTGFDISPAGIVLHGSLAVPRWPAPVAEFNYRTVPGFGPFPLGHGEYTALRSWIPGGTLQEFIWNQQGGPALHDDKHTFLFEERQGAGQINHLCLTVKGTRITASGPIAYQPVTGASYCAWRNHIYLNSEVDRLAAAASPHVALTQKSAAGAIEVVGHTSPWAPAGTSPEYTTNLIVHFPDQKSLSGLSSLVDALHDSGRKDTAVSILVVLAPDQIAHVKPIDGIAFADDAHGWEQRFGVKHRPETLLVDRNGDVVWRHEGHVSDAVLAAALKKHLVAGGTAAAGLLTSSVRAGQVPQNFVFDSGTGDSGRRASGRRSAGRGREETLRKLNGRAVVLAFWKSSSQASIATILDIEGAFANAGDQGPIVLAINDGDAAERATQAAAQNEITSIVVADPAREIALAYGVTVWPTTIFIDSNGLVSAVRYGRFSSELAAPPPGAQAAD
jgi:hypothetical protein